MSEKRYYEVVADPIDFGLWQHLDDGIVRGDVREVRLERLWWCLTGSSGSTCLWLQEHHGTHQECPGEVYREVPR